MDDHFFSKFFIFKSLIEQINDADQGYGGGEESSGRKNVRA
jgi:hypothetical protein